MTTPADPDRYLVRVADNRCISTAHASGIRTSSIVSHLGGLVVPAVDRYLANRGRTAFALSRIGFDFLGDCPWTNAT